jgi:hypothetical protein
MSRLRLGVVLLVVVFKERREREGRGIEQNGRVVSYNQANGKLRLLRDEE